MVGQNILQPHWPFYPATEKTHPDPNAITYPITRMVHCLEIISDSVSKAADRNTIRFFNKLLRHLIRDFYGIEIQLRVAELEESKVCTVEYYPRKWKILQ